MESQEISFSPEEVEVIQEMLAKQSSLFHLDQQVLTILFWTILALGVWSLIWKGLALWRAAKNEHKWWFFFMLIIHSLGILEIVYLIVYRKNKADTTKKEKFKNKKEVKKILGEVENVAEEVLPEVEKVAEVANDILPEVEDGNI